MDTEQLLQASQTLKILQDLIADKEADHFPAYAAMLGAFIGGISSILPTIVTHKLEIRRTRQAVTGALLAEISALERIIVLRGYVDALRTRKETIVIDPSKASPFQVDVPDHYSRIYQSLVSQIGIVDFRIARRIIEFHQIIDAVVQDIKVGGAFTHDYDDPDNYQQDIIMLEHALEIAKDLRHG